MWQEFWPCSSQEEAIQKLDELLSRGVVTEEHIGLKKKYNLANPTMQQIEEYHTRQIEGKKSQIESAKKVLKEREWELQKAEQEAKQGCARRGGRS